MSVKTAAPLTAQDKKYVKNGEFIWYLIAVFFYTNMTGMVGQFRNAYLVDVLLLNEKQASLFNALALVVPFILNFFIVMYIDGRAVGKSGKFRPPLMLGAVPLGVLLFLSFWAPKGAYGLAVDDLCCHGCRFVGLSLHRRQYRKQCCRCDDTEFKGARYHHFVPRHRFGSR